MVETHAAQVETVVWEKVIVMQILTVKVVLYVEQITVMEIPLIALMTAVKVREESL